MLLKDWQTYSDVSRSFSRLTGLASDSMRMFCYSFLIVYIFGNTKFAEVLKNETLLNIALIFIICDLSQYLISSLLEFSSLFFLRKFKILEIKEEDLSQGGNYPDKTERADRTEKIIEVDPMRKFSIHLGRSFFTVKSFLTIGAIAVMAQNIPSCWLIISFVSIILLSALSYFLFPA